MNFYLEELKKHSEFCCPYCSFHVLPVDYHLHCRLLHAFKDDAKCLWCLGDSRWPTEDHLVQCFRRFIRSLPRTIILDTYRIYDPEERVPPVTELINWSPKNSVIEKIVPLQHKGLELATAVVQTFLENNERVQWYHVVIRNGTVPPTKPNSTVLPFTCLCAKHRHLLVYVAYATEPWKNVQSKSRIDTVMQLVDLLGELGQPDRPCPMFLEGRTRDVNVPLPRCYELVCALQWVGGILDLVQRWYARVHPRMLLHVVRSFGGMWGVCVEDLPGIPLRFVIPVAKHLEPSTDAEGLSFHLTHSRAIRFKANDNLINLPLNDWIDYQAEKGNSVFEAIGKEVWFPTPHQQRAIGMCRQLITMVFSRDEEIAALKRELTLKTESLLEMQERHMNFLEKGSKRPKRNVEEAEEEEVED